ncbi:LCP family protein [Cyanobium sp. Aljojuca 7D2]|uniref:LCP family protein n=1 Tax=Cyanobium sp. Aljojuca 7D2 TaxID=2823698 RepID=UPI0020CE66C6|nr:LCP family protein [Cyanobium sp. Aljojuca 7D2]MCP9890485.1 LCP family protein [Cyanobium sp. Aljojuca 7D2]
MPRHPAQPKPRLGPTLLRLGAAAAGMAAGLGLLGLVWPEPDRSTEPVRQLSPADLGKAPSRNITLLVIGLDSEQPGDPLNQAAPRGPANADALLLVRVNPQGPLQVLTLPPNLAVQLPGQKRPQSLGSLYRLGGAALTADAVRSLVGLDSGEPDRYLVLGRASLRSLVDGLGSIAANPTRALRYNDKSQRFTVDLQGGLQRLKGNEVEQLVRYRDPARPEDSRQDNHQLVVRSLLREMALPEQLGRLSSLLQSLQNKGVVTNLSQAETLSLLAAGLSHGETVQFTSVPLAPSKAGQPLRQIASSAPNPLWQAPDLSAAAP